MGFNLDESSESSYLRREPTEEERAEAEAASYVVREIGKSSMMGYTNSLERAYGKALWFAERTMLSEGTQIDVNGTPSQHIELRISEDRSQTVVQWVRTEPVSPQTIEQVSQESPTM